MAYVRSRGGQLRCLDGCAFAPLSRIVEQMMRALAASCLPNLIYSRKSEMMLQLPWGKTREQASYRMAFNIFRARTLRESVVMSPASDDNSILNGAIVVGYLHRNIKYSTI